MQYKKEPYSSWSNPFTNTSYLFYKTKDNSNSVSLVRKGESTELMHSTDGAFSETLYLYQDIIRHTLKNKESKNVYLSLGLGLGYVEVLVCSYFLKYFPTKKFKLFSYEKDDDLRNFFRKFIFEETIPCVFYECYLLIIKQFSALFSLNESVLIFEIKKRILNNEIIFCDSFNMNTNIPEPVNGLFFDAFSIKTSPDLWEENLIHKILNSCASDACFATYASRSHLKQLLVSHGFILAKKKGYGGKKQSTFAYTQHK